MSAEAENYPIIFIISVFTFSAIYHTSLATSALCFSLYAVYPCFFFSVLYGYKYYSKQKTISYEATLKKAQITTKAIQLHCNID